MLNFLRSILSGNAGALAAANDAISAIQRRLDLCGRDARNLQSALNETRAALNQALADKTKMMIDLKRLGREYYLAMQGTRPVRSPFVADQFDIQTEVIKDTPEDMQGGKLNRLVINKTEVDITTDYFIFHDTPDALAEEVASALIEEALRSLIPSIAEQLRQQL